MRQLLPTRLRLTVQRLEQGGRDVVDALRAPRRSGVIREGVGARTHASRGEQRVSQASVAPRVTRPAPRPMAPPKPPVEPEVGAQAELAVIHFADSDVTVELDPGQSILQAGLAAGVDLIFSCTMGGCGACMLDVLEGQVVYDDPDGTCLTEGEKAAGTVCLACVGRPKGRVVLAG